MPIRYVFEPTKGEIVVVSAKRASRPKVFGAKPSCPFCPGNEPLTPPTTFALPKEKQWQVRCFENAFPIVKQAAGFHPCVKGDLLWRAPGFGRHEVIVETRQHGALLQDFDCEQLMRVVQSYKNRFAALCKRVGIQSVILFKNHGPAAGASIEHEHAQIIGLPFIYPILEKESGFAKSYVKKTGKCFYCELSRGKSGTVLFKTKFFTAIRPSFARFPFEFWLIPKDCVETFLEFSQEQDEDFAQCLARCARACFNVAKDYNIVFHNSAAGAKVHFHCEVIPRTNVWAGLELGAGVIVDSKDEKQAAQALTAASPR